MTCEGFEPTTPSLSRKCSPTELTSRDGRYILNYSHDEKNVNHFLFYSFIFWEFMYKGTFVRIYCEYTSWRGAHKWIRYYSAHSWTNAPLKLSIWLLNPFVRKEKSSLKKLMGILFWPIAFYEKISADSDYMIFWPLIPFFLIQNGPYPSCKLKCVRPT